MPSVSIFQPRVTRGGKTTISKIWHAAWRDQQTGRRCTKSTRTEKRQLAQRFARDLEDKLYRQSIGAYHPSEDHRDLRFAEAETEFLQAQEKRLRPASVDAYAQSLKIFRRLVKPQELRKIDRRKLDAFIAKRRDVVGPITINKDLRGIRAFSNWCRRQNYLATKLDFNGLFLQVDASDPTWIPKADVDAVLAALGDKNLNLKKRCANWWSVFFRTALFTGMRRSELLGLRWSEVKFDVASVQVNRVTSKGRKDRTYEMAESLTDYLRQWHDSISPTPKPSDFVLPFPLNLRSLYKDWYAILDFAGIPEEHRFTPHHCRSSCVSELLASGESLTSVRDWVGHSSVLVTERHYASTRADRKRIASDRKIV